MRPVKGLPARRAAARILTDVLKNGASLDEALGPDGAGADLARLDERDRALARLIVVTTLRRLPQIEAALAAFLKTPIDARAGGVPEILTSAAAQILFLAMPAHAVVNIATSLADTDRRGRQLKPVVNAVLRRLAAEGPAIIDAQDAAAMMLPDWLAARWRENWGESNTREIASLLLAEPPLDLTVPRECDAWAERLDGTVPVPGTVRLQKAGRIADLAGYDDGAWWVQDAAAALPVRLLGDVHGLDVVDLCAAPGGKTAQLAAGGANVIAVDRDARRMERLGANLTRLGLKAAHVVADAASWRPPEPVDVVLVDAPCSATGIMHRHPDILRRRRPEHLKSLVDLQAKLLDAAIAMVRPGGRIVYCTCSLEPEEGEDQIARVLRSGAPVRRAVPATGLADGFAASLTPAGDMRILPTALGAHGGNDGFFISMLNKVATNQAAEC